MGCAARGDRRRCGLDCRGSYRFRESGYYEGVRGLLPAGYGEGAGVARRSNTARNFRLCFGAFLLSLRGVSLSRRAVPRPYCGFISVFVMIGALVFLGCRPRMVPRLAGGGLNALGGLDWRANQPHKPAFGAHRRNRPEIKR